jgi:hypothetical protein
MVLKLTPSLLLIALHWTEEITLHHAYSNSNNQNLFVDK